MTRRELENALDRLRDRVDTGDVDRPDPLTSAEKQALNDLLDVDPWAENPGLRDAVRDLEDAYSGVTD